jgi:hypothetical protein
LIWTILEVKSRSFLEKIKTPQFPSEIIWPLVSTYLILRHFLIMWSPLAFHHWIMTWCSPHPRGLHISVSWPHIFSVKSQRSLLDFFSFNELFFVVKSQRSLLDFLHLTRFSIIRLDVSIIDSCPHFLCWKPYHLEFVSSHHFEKFSTVLKNKSQTIHFRAMRKFLWLFFLFQTQSINRIRVSCHILCETVFLFFRK